MRVKGGNTTATLREIIRDKKVVPYRLTTGNHGVFWGLKEFADPETKQPKQGREPLDDFEGLSLLLDQKGSDSDDDLDL